MGFFKEFKNDLSQAVTELLPEDNLNKKDFAIFVDDQNAYKSATLNLAFLH